MNPVAVGISGRIGSGKTALAQALAERLGCPHASFGEYVRGVARDRGLDAEDRGVLQDLGDELIAAGWNAFCHAVLQSSGYSGGSLVVDGIRHPEAAEVLGRIVDPVPWRLLAVEADADLRSRRLKDRGLNVGEVARAEGHPNESKVDAVLTMADYAISGSLTVAECADEAFRLLVDDLAPRELTEEA